ncbi:TniQ family protein, partial [Pseudooceanicola sp. C21-150M6]|uniref:TniQ family protein n=1 Tax=Pseudooceanicola sp. C21-150M6 TaxID=3434355 RepID=UPI003D7F2144
MDELLSSWVARVAARYGAEPLELMVYLAGQGGKDAGARQVDDVAPDLGLLRLWAKACRIDPERLRRRSLASRYPARPLDWFLTETVPVCLACFDADVATGRDAYLRGHWRLAEQVVCQSHRTMLLDRCPACRGGLRLTFRMLNGLLRPYCRKCCRSAGISETAFHLFSMTCLCRISETDSGYVRLDADLSHHW